LVVTCIASIIGALAGVVFFWLVWGQVGSRWIAGAFTLVLAFGTSMLSIARRALWRRGLLVWMLLNANRRSGGEQAPFAAGRIFARNCGQWGTVTLATRTFVRAGQRFFSRLHKDAPLRFESMCTPLGAYKSIVKQKNLAAGVTISAGCEA
jgi:hypothetical protein